MLIIRIQYVIIVVYLLIGYITRQLLLADAFY